MLLNKPNISRVAVPIAILSAFFILNLFFQKQVYGDASYNSIISPKNAIHSQDFWNSSYGVIFKCFLDIILTTFLLGMVLLLLKINISFLEILRIVSLAYSVFLLQMAMEFFVIKYYPALALGNLETFSLFSLYFFVNSVGIPLYPQFEYAAQIISLFEVAFWVLLAFFLYKTIRKSYFHSFKIVAAAYILPLFLWLLVVSFLLLLNNA